MKFDICLPNGMEGFLVPAPFAGPKEITQLAQEAEQLGYYAIWGFDFIAPTPALGISDSETPNWYELMITLACISSVTERLMMGAGVIIIPNRDPVLLAKQAATLDQFSNGRFLLGLGLGSREEFEAISPRERNAHRGNMIDEKLEALRLLLRHENKPTSYQGKHVMFKDVNMNPKPVQNPLPIYVAAHAKAPLERAAKWGLGPMVRDKEVLDAKRILAPLLEEYGRTLKDIDLTAWADLSIEPTSTAAAERYRNSRMGHFRSDQDIDSLVKDHWIGTVDEIMEKLVRLKNEGIEHFIVMHTATDTIEEMREQSRIFAEEVIPAVEKA